MGCNVVDPSHPGALRLRMTRGILVGPLCWAVFILLQLLGAFDGIDRKLYDARYGLRGERPASDRIALVAVDDRTIASFEHRWPLSRDVFALLLDGMQAAGPSAIGMLGTIELRWVQAGGGTREHFEGPPWLQVLTESIFHRPNPKHTGWGLAAGLYDRGRGR